MARYEIFNMEWVRGSTPPNLFRFQRRTSLPGVEPITRVPLVFDDARVSVYAGKKFLFRLSVVENTVHITDPDTGEIRFTPTADQTRMLVRTEPGEPGKNRYEIELRNGTDEQVYVMGTIAGVGGDNDDEGTP